MKTFQQFQESQASDTKILALIQTETKRNDPELKSSSDVGIANELFCAYLLNYKKWSPFIKSDLISVLRKMGKYQAIDSFEAGKMMSFAFLREARKMGYSGGIKQVLYVGDNPNFNLNGIEIDTRKNPSDIFVQFGSGPSEAWLGMSNKITTRVSGDIAFKNTRLGTLQRVFEMPDASSIINEYKQRVQRQYNIKSNSDLKKIKDNPEIRSLSLDCLNKVSDAFFGAIKRLQSNTSRMIETIAEYFLNAQTDLFPPYIKVTGRILGDNKYSADVENPIKSKKYMALLQGNFNVQKLGKTTVVIFANKIPICQVRFKWESVPFFKEIKTSVEPVRQM